MAKKWSEMTEQEINRLKQQQCMKCEYYSRWAGDGVNHATCEYITRVGHSRGCSPLECKRKGIFEPRRTHLKEKVQAKEQAKQDAEKAELDKQTAIAQAETDKVKAESAAAVAIEKAKGQAESNRLVSESLTPELIQMKEAEARLKHGWVTVQGADAVVTE